MSVIVIILLIVAIIAALLGIVGTFVPSLPGTPLCFASLLVTYFACPGQISLNLLIWMLVATLIVTILDYVTPIIFTKMGGGSKSAVWGTTIGTFAGLFFMPWGLILGPLAGAFIGEVIKNRNLLHATKVALMSFVSFVLSTGLKLATSLIITFFCFDAMLSYVKS